MTPTEGRDWRWVHGVAVLLVLGLFLWQLGGSLGPVVLFVALILLLHPLAGTREHRTILAAVTFLLGFWFLTDLGGLLAPFVLAFILAYILDPLVDILEVRKVPRSLAIVIWTLPVLALLGVVFALGIPALVEQSQQLLQRTPELMERFAGWVEGLQAGVLGLDLPFLDEEALAQRIRNLSPEAILAYAESEVDSLTNRAWEGILGLGRGLGTAVVVVSYVVLTPVLTFYLLRDWDRIVARFFEYVPRDRLDRWKAFAAEYDRLLSRYLHGQFLAASIVGILTGLGLWILDFPYAALVGAVAGVFNVVPFLGLPVSLVPALIISFISGSVGASLLKVAVVFVVVQFLDGNIIGPRIVGESVGLHPVLVLLAIAVAGFFFGFVGLLLAIPGAILVKMALAEALEQYRSSDLYQGEEAG